MNKNNPKLISALTCEQVITDNEGKNTLVGTFSNINANNFPARHAFMSLFCAWLNNKEQDQTYKLRVIVSGPVDQSGGVTKIEIPVKFFKDKTITYAVLNFQGIIFNGSGICWFEVYLDDEEIVRVPVIIGKNPLPTKA